jgi:hypothetical protein
MEYPTSGLDLHLNLGIRGADGHMAYRTTPADSSPDPSLRNVPWQGPSLNLCRDGLIETAHRSLHWRDGESTSGLGGRPARARRVSCQEFQDGSTGRHLIRMSFLTGLHARNPACDFDRLVDVRLRPDEAAQLDHALERDCVAPHPQIEASVKKVRSETAKSLRIFMAVFP